MALSLVYVYTHSHIQRRQQENRFILIGYLEIEFGFGCGPGKMNEGGRATDRRSAYIVYIYIYERPRKETRRR